MYQITARWIHHPLDAVLSISHTYDKSTARSLVRLAVGVNGSGVQEWQYDGAVLSELMCLVIQAQFTSSVRDLDPRTPFSAPFRKYVIGMSYKLSFKTGMAIDCYNRGTGAHINLSADIWLPGRFCTQIQRPKHFSQEFIKALQGGQCCELLIWLETWQWRGILLLDRRLS